VVKGGSILELTGEYQISLPLMLAVTLAPWTLKRWRRGISPPTRPSPPRGGEGWGRGSVP